MSEEKQHSPVLGALRRRGRAWRGSVRGGQCGGCSASVRRRSLLCLRRRHMISRGGIVGHLILHRGPTRSSRYSFVEGRGREDLEKKTVTCKFRGRPAFFGNRGSLNPVRYSPVLKALKYRSVLACVSISALHRISTVRCLGVTLGSLGSFQRSLAESTAARPLYTYSDSIK